MKSHNIGASVPLYSVAQIKEIEQRQMRELDSSKRRANWLMETAGRSAFDLMKKIWPNARRILILAGKGNNGGDGYVVARLATLERFKVTLCQLCAKEEISGDALTAFNRLPSNGLSYAPWSSVEMDQYDVIIDAILGTGIKGALRAPYPELINRVNQSKTPVLAVDIPSGLEADSGYVHSVAVKAQVTATFIAHKKGLFTGVSANYRGKVKLFSLGVQKKFYQGYDFLVTSENWNSTKHRLKPRQSATHKGDYGHCLIIGGDEGMLGAAALAASAAARTGSGLVSAFVQSAASAIVAARPEIMARNVNLDEIDSIDAKLNKLNALVIGPGLGQSDWSNQWMKQIDTHEFYVKCLKVIDADGLNWLAKHPNYDALRILTPHPGEAARLLGVSSEAINRDRFAASDAIARKYGGICVLKGSGTIISDGKKRQIVCPVGNPGMASGGMGDVLSGIIGGLLAQGFSLLDSALLGVCVHGQSADRAAGQTKLYRGMLASDLIACLPALMNPLREIL